MIIRACERAGQPRPGSAKAGWRIANRIESLFVTIYVLELVGATAVTSLGWAACRILQIDWTPFGPLWFAGYLFVYNLDRLYPDPADPMNVPVPSRKTAELRSARIGLTGVSWWLGASGLVSPATPAVLAGGGIGLVLSLFSQFRPMTISVLADLFLMLPAVVQFLAGISVWAAPHLPGNFITIVVWY